MSKTFEIKLSASAEEVIAAAKKAASKNGVTLEGDAGSGQFSGMGIAGACLISGEMLRIEITRKPLVMTWGLIEKSLKDFFAAA